MFTTLRTRLLVTYLGLIVLGFGGLTLLAGWQITNSAYTDFAATLRVNAALLASSLTTPEHEEHEEHGKRQTVAANAQVDAAAIQRTAASVNGRVLLLDNHGAVLFDSASQASRDSGFPMTTNSRSAYLFVVDEQGVEQIVTTAPIGVLGEESGYVQLAAPSAQLRAMVWQRWLVLGSGFLLFAVVGIVVSLWLRTSLTRPLARLRNTALALAAGDLQQRVPTPGRDEIGEVAQAFNQMATQVEAMLAEQRAFASNASHELRTPLTTIRLRTEPLLAGTLDPTTAQRYLTEINQEVVRMAGLVDDLILLSRLDAHRLAVGEEQVDAVRLVRRLQQELAPIAAAQDITLHLETPATPLSPIQTNMNHAHVVVRNLLDNALKYTPAGGKVVVTVAQQQTMVQLQVTDTGQGIAAEDLPNIAKRFYRADKARQRQTDGIGLGLALVQSIVDLYGGRLAITSAGINQGTTVTVWWPVQQPAWAPQGSAGVSAPLAYQR